MLRFSYIVFHTHVHATNYQLFITLLGKMLQKLKNLFNKINPINMSGCLSITEYNFTFSPHLHVYLTGAVIYRVTHTPV